jgi:hypothetical protein
MALRPIRSSAVLAAAATALLLAVVASDATASATRTVAFRLSNTTASPVSEMYFDLVPTGTILPPVIGTDPSGSPIEGSPMKALASSKGIDVSSAFVLLTEDPAELDMERMFLLFGFEPDPSAAPGEVPFAPLLDADGGRVGQLEPGGTFDFELTLAQGSIGYLLKSAIDGLTLSVLDVTSPTVPPSEGNAGGGPGGGNPGTQVPEPSALLLWSAIGLGTLGLARRRRARSARAIPA